MSATSMENFVRKLFEEVNDLSLLTQRIVREKYMKHMGDTEFSTENKRLLKQIVCLFLENFKDNNGVKNEQSTSLSPRRSPRKSPKKGTFQKPQSNHLGEPGSATSTASTVSSWAKTPPKTAKASKKRLSADQVRKAVFDSSPEKCSPWKSRKDVSPRKKSLVLKKQKEKKLNSPKILLRRSPRKAHAKAQARLNVEQARCKILEGEFSAEGDIALDSCEEEDEDDTEDDETQTSGSKKAKWKSKVIDSESEEHEIEEKDEEEVPYEPFQNEAPLGTYNSSDSDSSHGSGFVPSHKKKTTVCAKRRNKSWKRDSSSDSDSDDTGDIFAKLKRKREAGKGKPIGTQKTPVNKSEGETSQSEHQNTIVNGYDSESNQTPIKIKRRRPARRPVISDVESNHSTPAKVKTALALESTKTILDVVESDDARCGSPIFPGSRSDSSSSEGESSSIILKRHRKKETMCKGKTFNKTSKNTPKNKLEDSSSSEFEVPINFKSISTASSKAAITQSENSSDHSAERKVSTKRSDKLPTDKSDRPMKRKRSDSSSSSDSGRDNKCSHKGQKKRKISGLKKVEDADLTKNSHVRHLEKIARAVGGIIPVGRNYRAMFENCKTPKDRIKLLKQKLEEAGMKGIPSMKSVAAVKLQKEARELDLNNVIQSGGRSSRAKQSRYKPPAGKPLQTKPCTVRVAPLKTKLSNIRDFYSSEETESD